MQRGVGRAPFPIFCVSTELRFIVSLCEQMAHLLELRGERCQSAFHPERLERRLPRFRNVFTVSDTIRRTKTEDGGILLDIHHGQMFRLNVVGSRIIELLESGFDEAQIATEVSGAYATDLETVRADVHDFIETLQRHHILGVRSEAETG